MKRVITALMLIVMLSTACITVVTSSPSTPVGNTPVAPTAPPVKTPPQQPAGSGAAVPSTPSSFNLPIVATFSLQPANIFSGTFSTLTWDVRDSFDVTIEPRFGITRPSGQQPVNPQFTTTYKLTANNNQGSILATTTLTVSGVPPTIDTPVVRFFTPAAYVIRQGESTILSWQTIGGSSVSIDNGIGTVSGEGAIEVRPATTTTYMLSVTSPDGAQFQTTTVNVK